MKILQKALSLTLMVVVFMTNAHAQLKKTLPANKKDSLSKTKTKYVEVKIGPKYPLKTYKISVKNDTINAIGNNDLKYGKWVTIVASLRGEPGYEQEGYYFESKKDGIWRKYASNSGEILAYENYRLDCKHGQCFYYNTFGELEREEMWKGFDPKHPYDTIAIYGTGNGNIESYKIVLAKPYSVKNGTWNYYDTQTGRVIKSEEWEVNNIKGTNGEIETEKGNTTLKRYEAPKDKTKLKPQAAKDWDKKTNKKKKAKILEGGTGI